MFHGQKEERLPRSSQGVGIKQVEQWYSGHGSRRHGEGRSGRLTVRIKTRFLTVRIETYSLATHWRRPFNFCQSSFQRVALKTPAHQESHNEGKREDLEAGCKGKLSGILVEKRTSEA